MAFRNAKSLIQGLGKMLDHDPNDVDVREGRLDDLNRHYLDVSVQFDWLFLQAEVDWLVWEDRTGTSTGFTVAVTNASHLVTFSSSMGTVFTARNAGMFFVGPDGETYTIGAWASVTQAYLTAQYAGSTSAASSSWTIQIRRVALPVDCARALGFIDRTNGIGRLHVLDRRREETYLSTQTSTTGTVYWVVDDDAVFDRAPDVGLTGTDDTTGGSLAASTTYQYCYTFDYEGRESPPSVPFSITTSSAASHRIALTGIEDTRDGALETYKQKRLYRRVLTQASDQSRTYGRWLLLATLGSSTTTYTDSGSVTPDPALTGLRFQNGRKYMRPKWLPGDDATLRLRYLRYPMRMVADNDVPAWPESFHDLIMYGAAIDLAMQYGLEKKVPAWQRMYDGLLGRMKSEHLLVPDLATRKAQRGYGLGGGAPYRAGTITTDFSG